MSKNYFSRARASFTILYAMFVGSVSATPTLIASQIDHPTTISVYVSNDERITCLNGSSLLFQNVSTCFDAVTGNPVNVPNLNSLISLGATQIDSVTSAWSLSMGLAVHSDELMKDHREFIQAFTTTMHERTMASLEADLAMYISWDPQHDHAISDMFATTRRNASQGSCSTSLVFRLSERLQSREYLGVTGVRQLVNHCSKYVDDFWRSAGKKVLSSSKLTVKQVVSFATKHLRGKQKAMRELLEQLRNRRKAKLQEALDERLRRLEEQLEREATMEERAELFTGLLDELNQSKHFRDIEDAIEKLDDQIDKIDDFIDKLGDTDWVERLD